jgi:hypothetical protein
MTPTAVPVSSDFLGSIPREQIPAVIAALAARLLEPASPAAPSAQDEGPMLTPDEAATVLRRPRRWIYRNSEPGIRRWLATRKAV